MKMKKLLALLLSVVLTALLTTGCDLDFSFKRANKVTSSTPSGDVIIEPSGGESTSTPLLYKVSDGDSVIWLFGSVHVGREEFYPLPDYVLNAFNASDALAVEFDIVAFEQDVAAAGQSLMAMAYTDGTTIKDHVSPELYEEAVKVMKEWGGYVSYYDMFMPVLWAQLIEGAVYEKYDVINYDFGVDRHLLDKAKANGKEILEIESADFQYGMLADYSEPLQELLLSESIALYYNNESLPDEMSALMDLWQSGDEDAFDAALNPTVEFSSAEEERLYNEYNDAMIVERNLNMTDFAEEALADNNEIFICVGAAHVVGEGAMAKLLEGRGYTVEIVK